jgi:3,4-dihydroxy 2-butanone 4-phosphate synthase/GTP cyclohydrolase II
MPFSPLPDILTDLRAGKMIVLTDDESRENEGDLVLPAQFATPEAVTFMLGKALGYLCLSLTEADCDRLGLHPQGNINTSQRATAFTVSIDLHPKFGGTTGVSAKERAECIRMAIDPRYGQADFARPGHVNPLRSRDGGVLVRNGQTEGSVDLCRLAGLYPAACIIEIMKQDGEMARLPDLEAFCATHRLKMCSVAQIIEHRLARESLVTRTTPTQGVPVSTPSGVFHAHAFATAVDALPHVALTMGLEQPAGAPALVRMHRRNLLGDVFHAADPSGESSAAVLHASMRMIAREGRGAVVYLRTNHPHGTGDEGDDLETLLQTFRVSAGSPAGSMKENVPLRELGIGCQILRELGLSKLRLITASDRHLPGIEAYGLEIVGRVRPTGIVPER